MEIQPTATFSNKLDKFAQYMSSNGPTTTTAIKKWVIPFILIYLHCSPACISKHSIQSIYLISLWDEFQVLIYIVQRHSFFQSGWVSTGKVCYQPPRMSFQLFVYEITAFSARAVNFTSCYPPFWKELQPVFPCSTSKRLVFAQYTAYRQ